MAPHREGKRPQISESRIPRLLQAIASRENVNGEAENPQIVPKPRISHSAQVIARKGVSQPGPSSRSKPGSSRHTTSASSPVHVSNQSHPQILSTSSAVAATTLPSNSYPTPQTKTRHSPSQALTTAENVKELNISGGLFLNTPQAMVQVYGGIPSGCRPVEEIPQGRDNSLAVPDLEDVENSDPESHAARHSTQSKSNAKAKSQCTPMKDYDVYYRQLLLAGRGSPMWIPGPNMMLRKEYRRNGIGIGDVGIVYRSEGFSFLFNVFLPAGHPVNEGRVPDEFEPLDFGRVKKDLEKSIVYGRGHHLASSSLRNVSGVDPLGLVFETAASEGAILIMPDGATTEDLLNHKLLKAYIAKNAQSWYTYIREERGREVQNGDIRLVIGFDKVASWGIATFASSIEQQVRLEFKSNDSGQAASRAYSWNCVGGGSGRVGPQEEEMDDLRESNDASATDKFVVKNQTVFVRTLNFNLKGEAHDLTIHEIRSGDHSSNNSGPGPPSNQQPPSGSGGQSNTGSKESHSGQGNVNFQAAQFGLSVTQHPSNEINRLLLKKFPNAQIVITGDADWISALTKEDIIFPSPEDICARILSSCKLREIDGVVSFDNDHANSDGSPMSQDTNTPNIVVFGQTGSGKSSLINMLAGKEVADVSSLVWGCTTTAKSYDIMVDNKTYALWDTSGLNEGEKGSVPAEKAIEDLFKLVKEVSVNLIIYCVRGCRFTDIVRINFDLFCGIMCEGRVPVVLVVTGLEQEEVMEEWWTKYQKDVKRLGLSFDGHACVTTIKGRNNIYEKEYQESTDKVWGLVKAHCNSPPWTLAPGWRDQVPSTIAKYMAAYNASNGKERNVLPRHFKPSAGKVLTPQKSTPHGSSHNIILFGDAGSGKSSIVNMIVGNEVAKVAEDGVRCTFQNKCYDARIGETAFSVYDTRGLNEGERDRALDWKAVDGLYTLLRQLDGVSLLIYCMRGKVTESSRGNWMLFNRVICDEKVPIIAVVTGLEHAEVLEDTAPEAKAHFEASGMRPKELCRIVSIRGKHNEFEELYNQSQQKLQKLVAESCSRQKWNTGTEDWFGRIYQNVYTTGPMCFLPKVQVQLVDAVGNVVEQFIKESNMEADEARRLKDTLLRAEKKLLKKRRSLW